MEIRQLRYFVAVVESGSLSRAASILHVVQSALSQQMMQLEEDLGAALLLRSARGVQVTEAGAVLFRHATAILKQLDNARGAVLGSTGAVHGAVSFGIPHSSAVLLAAPLLARVRRDYPAVRLSVIEAPSGQLVEMLASGRLDFSLLYHTKILHGLEIATLLAEPLCLLTPAHLQSGGARESAATVPLESLAGMPLIVPGMPNATRVLLELASKACGFDLRVVAEVAALDTIHACVAAGLASTVLTAANVARVTGAVEPGHLESVITPRIERDTVIARSRDFPTTQAADLVRALAREIAVELVAGGKWPGARLLTGGSFPAGAEPVSS